MSRFEKTWWFAAAAGGASAFCTVSLLQLAGQSMPDGWAQWLVYFICFFGIWRGITFVTWLALLLAAPSSPLLDKIHPAASRPGRA